MKRLIARLSKACRSERGDSNVIVMIIIFPLLWAIIMTILDMGVFMTDRTIITNTLREGARSVSIVGGTTSDLAGAYGISKDVSACRNDHPSLDSTATDSISCVTAQSIDWNAGLVRVAVKNVKCGPDRAERVGDAVYCQAAYTYVGFPGSAMGFFGTKNLSSRSGAEGTAYNESGNLCTSPNLDHGWNEGCIKVSAQSEVTTVH